MRKKTLGWILAMALCLIIVIPMILGLGFLKAMLVFFGTGLFISGLIVCANLLNSDK